jgi:hypothetical protein
MADAKEAKARKDVRAAQAQFERERATSQEARRRAFIAAQKSGLSLRQIGDEVGLHRSRVAQIIAGK